MKKRILALSLSITIVGIIVFAFASVKVYHNTLVAECKKYLRVYGNFADVHFSPNQENAIILSKKMDDARITFIDSDGNVIADSVADDITENHANRDEFIQAKQNGEGFSVRASSTLGENMAYFCKKVENAVTQESISPALNEYFIRIAQTVPSSFRIFLFTLPTLTIYLVLDVIICVALTFVLLRFILNPVWKLTKNAESGVDVKSEYPELYPLAKMLNDRNKSIKNQIDEIQREKNAAEKAKKSKDEFISNVTHEMNTPLTSIHGYAELLNLGGMTVEQTTSAYKTIMTQSERLENLISSILHYSEIDNENLELYEVDFSSLAKEIVDSLKPEAAKNDIKIIENIKNSIRVVSRHEYLTEILGNLLRNAIRYNKKGGSVTVTLNKDCLIVEDTGIGISESEKSRIFERFFTVDKSHNGKHGGFGLGLAIVRKICRLSGWTITVESTLGEGSKFEVRFEKFND